MRMGDEQQTIAGGRMMWVGWDYVVNGWMYGWMEREGWCDWEAMFDSWGFSLFISGRKG